MKAPHAASGEPGPATVLRQMLLLLERMHKQLAGALHDVLAQEPMNLAEWLIVSEVATTGEATLSRIATELARDPGSLSRTITRLIQRDLLQSVRNDSDRRRTTLSLTKAGHAVHVRLARGIDRLAGTDPVAMATFTKQFLLLLQARHASPAVPFPTRGAPRRQRQPSPA